MTTKLPSNDVKNSLPAEIDLKDPELVQAAKKALKELAIGGWIKKKELNPATGRSRTVSKTQVPPSLPAIMKILQHAEPDSWGDVKQSNPGVTLVQLLQIRKEQAKKNLDDIEFLEGISVDVPKEDSPHTDRLENILKKRKIE